MRRRFTQLDRRGGFTLVELIVVLMILSVMTSWMVRSMVGYIDRMNEKRLISETNQVIMAVEALYMEKFGSQEDGLGRETALSYSQNIVCGNAGEGLILESDVLLLAGVEGECSGVEILGGKVTELIWRPAWGDKECLFHSYADYTIQPKDTEQVLTAWTEN